jgi:elongation factor Ts
MKIPTEKIKELREQTGAGVVECKNVLEESKGDIEEAVKILRKKGLAKAGKKASRQTGDGLIASYIHPGSKIGVLVEVNCETDFVAKNGDFKQLVKDITMHIAASNPQYITSDEVPQEIIEQEKGIVREEFSDKPDNIVEKIALGRLKKYFSENCLMDQPFVKDEDITIKDYVASYIAKLGENIKIKRFARYMLGEE